MLGQWYDWGSNPGPVICLQQICYRNNSWADTEGSPVSSLNHRQQLKKFSSTLQIVTVTHARGQMCWLGITVELGHSIITYSSTETHFTDLSGLCIGPESHGWASVLVCLPVKRPPSRTMERNLACCICHKQPMWYHPGLVMFWGWDGNVQIVGLVSSTACFTALLAQDLWKDEEIHPFIDIVHCTAVWKEL